MHENIGETTRVVLGDVDSSFSLRAAIDMCGFSGEYVSISAVPLSTLVEDFKPRWWDNEDNLRKGESSSEMVPASLKDKRLKEFERIWNEDTLKDQSRTVSGKEKSENEQKLNVLFSKIDSKV